LNAIEPHGALWHVSHPWKLLIVNDELERILSEVRSGRTVELTELEQAYTSGCAEVLELEADSVRVRRRLDELHEQLRHIRTAIEWLQEVEDSQRAAQ
jgi:hypothetical protein